MPEKLAEMKDLFLLEIHQEQEPADWRWLMVYRDSPSAGRARSSVTEWTFEGAMTRMSESAAPKLGIVDTVVSMEVDVPANANGVLYALGGFAGD